jgi:hypothetical protein
MRRRDVLIGAGALAGTLVTSARAQDYEYEPPPEMAAMRKKFPYRVVEVSGRDVLMTWSEMAKRDGVTPIVIGGEEDFDRVVEQVVGFDDFSRRPVGEILEAAGKLTHPGSMRAVVTQRSAENRAYIEKTLAGPDSELPPNYMHITDGGLVPYTPSEVREMLKASLATEGGVVGEWPSRPVAPSLGLTVAEDVMTGSPWPKVYIAVLPTKENAAAPAFLNWGGWNDCPAPDYQVAALRSWHERYGATVVGMSGDVMNIQVTRKPNTREEAMALAREHYEHCYDIVDQGVETLSNLAAGLMVEDWWYFWWD